MKKKVLLAVGTAAVVMSAANAPCTSTTREWVRHTLLFR